MEENEEEEEEEEEDGRRRRIVCVMKTGKLKPLDGGVEDFETSLEKRLKKVGL